MKLKKEKFLANEKLMKCLLLSSCCCCFFVFFSKMLTARKTNLITACVRNKNRSARMLASARKDHSIPLLLAKNAELPLSNVTVISVVDFLEL